MQWDGKCWKYRYAIILILIFIAGYFIGLNQGKAYYFDEDKAIEMIEHKLKNTDELFRFDDMVIKRNLTVGESINLYLRYGIVSQSCLRLELRKICLNSEKS